MLSGSAGCCRTAHQPIAEYHTLATLGGVDVKQQLLYGSGGVIYEQTGSYDIVWWLAAGLALMAACVHWGRFVRSV